MTTNRREAFQPEELALLGSAFEEIWAAVGAELGYIDPKRKAAARTRLANIIVLLAKSGEFDPNEIKDISVQIFHSIEAPNGQRKAYRNDTSPTPRAFNRETLSPDG